MVVVCALWISFSTALSCSFFPWNSGQESISRAQCWKNNFCCLMSVAWELSREKFWKRFRFWIKWKYVRGSFGISKFLGNDYENLRNHFAHLFWLFSQIYFWKIQFDFMSNDWPISSIHSNSLIKHFSKISIYKILCLPNKILCTTKLNSEFLVSLFFISIWFINKH